MVEKAPEIFWLAWLPEKKAGFHKVNQKKIGCHALENLRCFCHPEKSRVNFTGYPSNHFSGCSLNGRRVLTSNDVAVRNANFNVNSILLYLSEIKHLIL